MATVDGHWQPGIGDPTPLGWLTVAAYAIAAVACWRASAHDPRAPRFWLLLSLMLAALGINKQLDLQSLVTQWGRIAAHAGGWYAQRHAVQAAFIAAVVAGGVLLLGFLMHQSRHLTRARGTALAGLVGVVCFVLIRAASFHHIDRFLGAHVVPGLRWNWLLELGGITLVTFGALMQAMPWRSRHNA